MRNIILTLAAFNDELLDQKDLQMWGENLLKKDLKKKEKRHALDHKKRKKTHFRSRKKVRCKKKRRKKTTEKNARKQDLDHTIDFFFLLIPTFSAEMTDKYNYVT